MKSSTIAVNYRNLTLHNLRSEEFNHVKLLLFWPIFGILFLFAERFHPTDTYIVMHCAWDDLIPFQEWFLIPYLFWFLFLIGMHLYTLLYDVETFRKMMYFIIFTYTTALIIYFLFPTCQELRPEIFPRDNALTRFLTGFYQFDTNTNVCPSLHVVGSLAVFFAAWHTPKFRTKGWRIAFSIVTILICISTVFLKQHSLLDIVAAIPICVIGYTLCYRRKK